MRVNRCTECERLWRAHQDATETQMKAAELLRLALKHLGNGSITLDQHRRSAKDARKQLEALDRAFRGHAATHEQRD